MPNVAPIRALVVWRALRVGVLCGMLRGAAVPRTHLAQVLSHHRHERGMDLGISRRNQPCGPAPPPTPAQVGDRAASRFAEGETGREVHVLAHVTVCDIGRALPRGDSR
jgi:hypothetical protein